MAPLSAMQWFGDNVWSIWLILGFVLAGAEMITTDFTLLMMAGGALAGAAVAAVFPGAVVAQVLVAVAIAFLLLALLRPTLLRRIRNAPGYRNSLDKLVGSEGEATEQVTRMRGQVKVNGEIWSARTFDSSMSIEAGQPIEVYELDGTTLIVYPVNRGLPPARPGG